MDGDVPGILAVRRGAILCEPEAIVPVKLRGEACQFRILLDAGANAEETILQGALVFLIPIGGRHILGDIPGLNVKILNATIFRVP